MKYPDMWSTKIRTVLADSGVASSQVGRPLFLKKKPTDHIETSLDRPERTVYVGVANFTIIQLAS